MRIRLFRPFWGCIAILQCFSAIAVSAGPAKVVTTFYPIYVAALNVTQGIPDVHVVNLAPPRAGCLHEYQLSPADLRKIAGANLVLANGAGLEPFLSNIARQSPQTPIVEVSSGIELTDGNPHVWLSFQGYKQQVDNIAEAIASVRPGDAEALRANARAYRARIDEVETRARAVLAPYAGAPVLTFHAAFPYLARELGLEVAGVIETEPGSEPSARELADIIRLVRRKKVRAVFCEPGAPGASVGVIAREEGLTARELDLAVDGPDDPGEARGAWLRAMEKNAAALGNALRVPVAP